MDRRKINILSLRRQNAIGPLGNLPREANDAAKNVLVDEIVAYDMAIKALQKLKIVNCRGCKHWDKEIMYCNHTGMQIEAEGYCVYGKGEENEQVFG